MNLFGSSKEDIRNPELYLATLADATKEMMEETAKLKKRVEALEGKTV